MNLFATALIFLLLASLPVEVGAQGKGGKGEVDVGLEDLSKDLKKVQSAAEKGKPVEVPFVRLKKRADFFIGTKLCHEASVLYVAEDMAVSRIQVAIRIKGQTSLKDQCVLVVLGPTHVVEGDLIRFCGTVTGATVIETWAGWTVPAVEFLVDSNDLKKIPKKAPAKKQKTLVCPEKQDQCNRCSEGEGK